MVQIQTMTLAELGEQCRGVELERLIRYLTDERGTQFFARLDNARVCWTYTGGPTRQGFRLLDGGAAGDGGESFSGFITVAKADAVSALRYGAVQVSSVAEAWPASRRQTVDNDVRPIPKPDLGRRMRNVAAWSSAPGNGDAVRTVPLPVAESDGADATPDAVEWTLTAETIFVDRAMATSAIRTLCGVDAVETDAWAADAHDAAAFRALPKAERSKRLRTLAERAEQQKDKVIGALILALVSVAGGSKYLVGDRPAIDPIAKKLTELMTSGRVALFGLKDRNLRELLRNGLNAVKKGDLLGDDESTPDP